MRPALDPGQFDEMIEASRKALYRIMPDKAEGEVGGLAITLVRVLMHAAEELMINEDVADKSQSDFSKWISLGVAAQCKRNIHDVYFGLREQGLIPDDLPEEVPG